LEEAKKKADAKVHIGCNRLLRELRKKLKDSDEVFIE
jgi:hypothetical protein